MDIFWVLLIGIPIVIVLKYLISREDVNAVEPVAAKYGGKVVPNSWTGSAGLKIPYRGFTLQIMKQSYGKAGPPDYNATLELGEAHFPELSLSTNSMILKWIGKYGDDRILTGDERFDQLFIVRSQNRPAVMKVLTDDVRAKLKDPAFMMPSFTMKPTQFNMTTAFDFTRDKQLSNQLGPQPHRQMFIDTVLAILDQAWS